MDEFCKKANITGYAKIVLDAVNSTVNQGTQAAAAAINQRFTYNATGGSVNKI